MPYLLHDLAAATTPAPDRGPIPEPVSSGPALAQADAAAARGGLPAALPAPPSPAPDTQAGAR